jgi:hypothetical protein
MERYLREVGTELAAQGLTADIVIVGGAFMTLVLRAREATKDVDAYFDPSTAPAVRAAGATVAAREGLAPDWLNDAVMGFFATSPTTTLWPRSACVNAVTAEYTLAMTDFCRSAAGRVLDVKTLSLISG